MKAPSASANEYTVFHPSNPLDDSADDQLERVLQEAARLAAEYRSAASNDNKDYNGQKQQDEEAEIMRRRPFFTGSIFTEASAGPPPVAIAIPSKIAANADPQQQTSEDTISISGESAISVSGDSALTYPSLMERSALQTASTPTLKNPPAPAL